MVFSVKWAAARFDGSPDFRECFTVYLKCFVATLGFLSYVCATFGVDFR